MCMSTVQMRYLVEAVEAGRPSAVFSGIVPDRRHLGSGGYHVCLIHLAAHKKLGDYSSSRPLDRSPKVSSVGKGYSCAADISMSPADMKRTYASVRRVWSDRSDPRRKWINAINCWRGSGDAQRFNFQQNTLGYASPDHKGHVHVDLPRAYVDPTRSRANADKAARAAASTLTGESKASWIAREEQRYRPNPVDQKPAVHTVVAGDTLYAIAKAAGISVADLQTWNGLHTATIFPRQVLRLTAPAPAPKPPPKPAPPVPTWPVGARDYFRPRPSPPHYLTVQRWQAVMKAHGWKITDDGYLGPRSEDVLVAFQRAEKTLKVTRVLDKATFVRAFRTTRRGK